MAIEDLSAYYGSSAIFLEQNSASMFGNRYGRFYVSVPDPNDVFPPWNMLDGGYKYSYGPQGNYYNTYKALVDEELNRAPEAIVNATVSREGNQLIVEAAVTNQKNVTLSHATNAAAVTVIVYEDIGVASSEGLTGRLERAVHEWEISSLAYNATGNYTITVLAEELTDVRDWDKLHTAVVVEYQPETESQGTYKPYNMLQAVLATPVPLKVAPASAQVLVDAILKQDKTIPVTVTGSPSSLSWTATPSAGWLSVTPASGLVGATPVIRVNAAMFSLQGLYIGKVTFKVTVSGVDVTREVEVRVTVAEVFPLYLPDVQRW